MRVDRIFLRRKQTIHAHHTKLHERAPKFVQVPGGFYRTSAGGSLLVNSVAAPRYNSRPTDEIHQCNVNRDEGRPRRAAPT